MKRFMGGIAAVALALGFTASTAAAQLPGNPTYAIMAGPGVTLAGEYGRGLNDESFKTDYFGGRIAIGLPMVSFWGGAGAVKNGESEVTFGGGVAINVIKGPLVPVAVSLQAGVGYLSEDGENLLIVPIGAVLAINVPNSPVDVRPWVMPRVEIQRTSNGVSQTEVGFGVSGGLNVTLPGGLGFHAALDWMTIDYGSGSVKPLLAGGGIHYRISVPSLGVL